MKQLFNKTVTAYKNAVTKTTAVLRCNRGEGYTDFALRILIAVVLGALLLAGMYLLLSGTVLPNLTEKVKDLFNYNGP